MFHAKHFRRGGRQYRVSWAWRLWPIQMADELMCCTKTLLRQRDLFVLRVECFFRLGSVYKPNIMYIPFINTFYKPHGSTNITSKTTILYNISCYVSQTFPLLAQRARVAALRAPPLGALKATHFSCPSIALAVCPAF